MKKYLVLLLAFAMLFTAFGATAEGWDAPQDEKYELHIAIPEQSDFIFAEGESVSDNLWLRRFEEKYNIDIVVDWSSLDYGTKLNLAIAAEQLPDMFRVDTVQLNQLIASGKLADIGGYYEEYASPRLKSLMEEDWNIVEVASRDGAIYAVPEMHYGYETLMSFAWVREDWAKAAGFEEFENVDSITELMDTFKQENGAEYGVMLDKTLSGMYEFAPAMHAYPNVWVEGEDGSIIYGATAKEMKDVLQVWADWYAKGYIRSDFGTLDGDTMLQDAYQGKVGLYFNQNWYCFVSANAMVENQGKDAYLAAYDIPSCDDEPVKMPVAFPCNTWNVVSADCEHPELIWQLNSEYVYVMNDAVANGEMTVEEQLLYNTNNMQHVTGPFKLQEKNYPMARKTLSILQSGEKLDDYSGTCVPECLLWLDNGDVTGLGRYLQMGYEGASLTRGCNYVDEGKIFFSKLWGDTPQAVLDYGSTLNDILTEGFTQIIMGAESLDYFDTLVANWYAAGGDVVTEAVNAVYGD